MTNPSPVEATFVDLGDGVRREIKFKHRVLHALKSKCGVSIMDGTIRFDEETLPVMLEAALVDRKLTADQIMDIMAPADFVRLLEQVAEAMATAFGVKHNEPESTEKN